MKKAVFDPHGGPIKAEVRCEPNRDGSYSLTIWDAGENSIVKRWKGNFINTDDDQYELPGNSQDHKGRLLEALVVVAIPAGVGPSVVSLTVDQDGNRLAKESTQVPPASAGAVADLFIELGVQA